MNKLWWYRLTIKWDYFGKFQVNNALVFLEMAWLSLRGKFGIIESNAITSKGGYKYLQLNVSRLPVSENHIYGRRLDD